ncbi:MAG: hypothetical protein ABIP20_11785 [Chthoniobacteraceae bacterium]
MLLAAPGTGDADPVTVLSHSDIGTLWEETRLPVQHEDDRRDP